MKHIEKDLAAFNATCLTDIETIKLMKRYDTKFIFHRNKLQSVFDYLRRDYQVLEIDHKRSFRYENLYYDTNDYFFYHQHHNQRVNRYKLRCRKYIESDNCYFEIKFKNNKKKTIKTRILLEDKKINHELLQDSKEFARKSVLIDNGNIVDEVRPALWIGFNRITFANVINKERLTFDINLTYTDMNANSRKINNLIIAELKSEHVSLNSSFYQYLKCLEIFPTKFSKYCVGIALTEKNIKCNRFKKNLLILHKYN
jgi:hypothetical protein